MKTLVFGGSGSIGNGIVKSLIDRGHEVLALARSGKSAEKLRGRGATVVMGDIRHPEAWAGLIETCDSVVHAAATWDDDMARVDRELTTFLLNAMSEQKKDMAFIYTGGCWLYGNTGDEVATEDTPFDVIDQFDDSVPTINKVLSAAEIRGMVIHPAMVYEANGGVFASFYEDAAQLGYIRVIGNEQVRWPLVHNHDLGLLYALMLEKGRKGDVYNAAAVEGLPIGTITRAIATRLGVPQNPVITSVRDAVEAYGPWAEGYAIDQQMSGRKAMEQLNWQPRHLDPIEEVSR